MLYTCASQKMNLCIILLLRYIEYIKWDLKIKRNNNKKKKKKEKWKYEK